MGYRAWIPQEAIIGKKDDESKTRLGQATLEVDCG